VIISRNSQGGVPSWMMKGIVGEDIPDRASAVSAVDDSNELAVMKEMERIAESGGKFYYDKSIDQASLSKVSEMAEIAGVDISRVVPTDAATAASARAAAVDQPVVHKKIEPVDIVSAGFADPDSFRPTESWNDIESSRPKSLSETPDQHASVRSIRGGDDYLVSPEMKPRVGEASIVSPTVRGLDDKSPSTKDTIISEQESRKNAISFSKPAWEAEVASQTSSTDVPRSGITRGEGADTNRHRQSPIGQFSIMHDRESGGVDQRLDSSDTIRSANDTRRSDIQRPTDKSRDWDSVQSSVPSTVSDIFYESLKKALG
jgi:hypothetical protein